MAIGLLATITVQEGKNAEFEEAFSEFDGAGPG
jgi:heme-degrading monooxygenase HmoA